MWTVATTTGKLWDVKNNTQVKKAAQLTSIRFKLTALLLTIPLFFLPLRFYKVYPATHLLLDTIFIDVSSIYFLYFYCLRVLLFGWFVLPSFIYCWPLGWVNMNINQIKLTNFYKGQIINTTLHGWAWKQLHREAFSKEIYFITIDLRMLVFSVKLKLTYFELISKVYTAHTV